MSASYLVDLGNTVQQTPSLPPVNAFPCSGAVVGNTVNMLYSNSYCNMQVVGAISQSGRLRIAIQTSSGTLSGSFTDPTSGLPAGTFPPPGFPGFQSGGVMWINSGAGLLSGFSLSAAFQRPAYHENVRAIALSGDFWQAILGVNLISQLKTTGSGAGFSQSPLAASTINV